MILHFKAALVSALLHIILIAGALNVNRWLIAPQVQVESGSPYLLSINQFQLQDSEVNPESSEGQKNPREKSPVISDPRVEDTEDVLNEDLTELQEEFQDTPSVQETKIQTQWIASSHNKDTSQPLDPILEMEREPSEIPLQPIRKSEVTTIEIPIEKERIIPESGLKIDDDKPLPEPGLNDVPKENALSEDKEVQAAIEVVQEPKKPLGPIKEKSPAVKPDKMPEWLQESTETRPEKEIVAISNFKERIIGKIASTNLRSSDSKQDITLEDADYIALSDDSTQKGNGLGMGGGQGMAITGPSVGNKAGQVNRPTAMEIYRQKLRNQISYFRKYPGRARRMGREGTAIVRFSINRQGSISSIKVHESSGYKSLDKATLKAIQSIDPFQPIPEEIEEVPIVFEIPVRFELN